MKIEEQVVSLELAKELKELGVNQDSLWYWVKSIGNYQLVFGWDIDIKNETYAAFTVAELGDIIKSWCIDNNFCQNISLPLFDKQQKKWSSFYAHNFLAETEADARANMVIYLIKAGVL